MQISGNGGVVDEGVPRALCLPGLQDVGVIFSAFRFRAVEGVEDVGREGVGGHGQQRNS
jgi:hypothetical protein